MPFTSACAFRKRRRSSGRKRIARHAEVMTFVVLVTSIKATAADSAVVPRWGHAAMFIPSPPSLLIQGGKTDPSSSYTYSSSPNTNQALFLPLDTSFSSSSATFSILNTSSAPSYAWHTYQLTAQTGDLWQYLSFGGDGGTSEAVQTAADSTWLVNIDSSASSVEYTHEPTAWGSQPMRRIYHSAAGSSDGGKIYITGGLKDDGSGSTFSDVYAYDPAASTFTTLPSLPIGLYHHTSLLLPNGTLLALGGAYTSPTTGSAALQPYSTIYVLDTTASSPSWSERSAGGSLPDGRRGSTAVLNSDGTKAFVFGGANAPLTVVHGDGWVLDLDDCSWKQVSSEDEGAGPRLDHAAVPVGNGQVVIFGGYGDGAPADSDVHIWDSNSNSWLDSFTPATSATTASATTTASAATSIRESGGKDTSTVSGSGSVTKAMPETAAGTASMSMMRTQTTSTGPTAVATDAGAYSHPLTTPIRVGLALGILGLLAAVLGVCLWQYRRRQRRRRAVILARTNWPSTGSKGQISNAQYGMRENGSPNLLQSATSDGAGLPPADWKKGASIGLGMGAIGAGLASISSKFGARRQHRPSSDPYAEIQDEASPQGTNGDLGGPLRKSTRRVGHGIRLLGPPPQRDKSIYYSPARPSNTLLQDKPVVRAASIARNSRIAMFEDEDLPREPPVPRPIDEEEDWEIQSDQSPSRWKSARSILDERRLASDSESFLDDEDELGPILPPFRGGPVPTPHDSRTDLGTYDEIATMSNPYSELSRNPYSEVSRDRYSLSSRPRSGGLYLPESSPSDPLDLAGLLTPSAMNKRYSDTSVPRSERSGRSGGSNAISDAEEGVLQEAQRIRHVSPSIISPVETAYEPIKRTESFFRRMAAGGISSLLRSHSNSPARQDLIIRDPAPQPTLWPVMSKDEVKSVEMYPSSPTFPQHPPSSWRADVLEPPRPAHSHGPSLSSLQSARSMRDMVIVQREASASSVESSVVIEQSPTSFRHEPRRSLADELQEAGARQSSEPTPRTSSNEPAYVDLLSPLMSESQTSSSLGHPQGTGHHRHGRTTGLETPGSIVFNGADFTSPTLLPSIDDVHTQSQTSPSRAADVVLLPFEATSELSNPSDVSRQTPKRQISLHPASQITPDRPSSPSHNIPQHVSAPPSGSPVPLPLVSHRRPVRAVVESINKRGGKTPMPPASLFSPVSAYSPTIPGAGRVVFASAPPALMSTIPEIKSTGRSKAPHSASPDPAPSMGPTSVAYAHTSGPPALATLLASRTASSSAQVPLPDSGVQIPSAQAQPPGRATTMWEVIKRERLKVANPDNGRGGAAGLAA